MMDFEIIPNWHPILVHFTVGLLSISALLHFAGLALKKPHLLIAGRWNLWLGALITVGTVLAGWDAYNSVAHDAASHAAMTDHKNWALTTASLFILLALWSLWKHRGAKTVSPVFVGILLIAAGLLAVTGYKGGEVVYRHGTGVMRMPVVQGDGGHGSHSHGGEAAETDHHMEDMPMDMDMMDHDDMPAYHHEPTIQEEPKEDHSDHNHKH